MSSRWLQSRTPSDVLTRISFHHPALSWRATCIAMLRRTVQVHRTKTLSDVLLVEKFCFVDACVLRSTHQTRVRWLNRGDDRTGSGLFMMNFSCKNGRYFPLSSEARRPLTRETPQARQNQLWGLSLEFNETKKDTADEISSTFDKWLPFQHWGFFSVVYLFYASICGVNVNWL